MYDSLFGAGLKKPFDGAITNASATELLRELGTYLKSADTKLIKAINKRERSNAQFWVDLMDNAIDMDVACKDDFDRQLLNRCKQLSTDPRRRKLYNNRCPPPGELKLDEFFKPKRAALQKDCIKASPCWPIG